MAGRSAHQESPAGGRTHITCTVLHQITPVEGKEQEALRGLVWGLKRKEQEPDNVVGDQAWFRSPVVLATVVLVAAIVLDVLVA